MDSRIAPTEMKPIYWIPSGETDWPKVGRLSIIIACALVFWWGIWKFAVLISYVVKHSIKPF